MSNHFLLMVFGLVLAATDTFAQDTGLSRDLTVPERHALAAIYDDVQATEAALDIHRRAMLMPAGKRFEYLAEWVLPGIVHDRFRLALDFTPTYPAPPQRPDSQVQTEAVQTAGIGDAGSVQAGGELVSPALDLAFAADELGRLDELGDRIRSASVIDEQQQRSQLALLSVVNALRGDSQTALKNLDELFVLVKASKHTQFAKRWPETLAVWFAVRHPKTRVAAVSLLDHIFLGQVRPGIDSGSEAWRHQMAALVGLSRYLQEAPADAKPATFTSPPPLTQWTPASITTAQTCGQGFPVGHWQAGSAGIDSLASHDVDYLYFGIPLRGNFELECDVTAPGWKDSYISVAGSWVQPGYKYDSYQVGNYRDQTSTVLLDPALSRVRGWTRYRATVRDGVRTIYFSGRKIHQETLPADHDPWIALRSTFRKEGGVRNLRITGSPQIPESIRLSASEDLTGWLPYFGETVGGRTNRWRQTGNLSEGGTITGLRDNRLPTDCGGEQLLQYHRPVLEDGVIEYDFYYRDQAVLAHPAIGRLAFLLDKDGISTHRITDGAHDRTSTDPRNRSAHMEDRRGPAELPLKAEAWNRMKVSLTGNTVYLNLNGTDIYEHVLTADNQRRFGLFHFSDQTEARVRNIVWTGNWLKELPPVSQQELAGDGTEFLDEDLQNLTAVFEHDFAAHGLPTQRFTVSNTKPEAIIAKQDDGVRIYRPGLFERYPNVTIAPRCIIRGDFDVTATFTRFEPQPIEVTKNTTCTLALAAILADQQDTTCTVYRRHTRLAGKDDFQSVHGSFGRTVDNQLRNTYFGTIPFDAESGTMRLARRGQTLYYLIAEQDSACFRLVGQEPVSTADVASEGINLRTLVYGLGASSVVWTKLSIRATEIINLPSEDPAETIDQLRQQLTGNLPDNALQFDGATQYVSVPSVRYDGSHPITLEAWVTHESFGSVALGDTQQSGVALGVPGNRYNMHAWNGNGYTAAVSAVPPSTNTRVHLAGTFDGQSLTLFVDGKPMKKNQFRGNFTASGFPLTIGASPSPGETGIDYAFEGIIDEVRVSNTVRYTEAFEPTDVLQADADTIAVYHFDEGAGRILRDSSGNGHDGEIHGANWVGADEIRHQAAIGLAGFGRQAVDVLIEELKHANPVVRLKSAMALAMIGTDAQQAIPALKIALEDPDRNVRAAATEALSRIKPPGLLQQLLKSAEGAF